MGLIIRARADAKRLEQHVRTTLRNALARGGEVGGIAQDRLGAVVVALDTTLAGQNQAQDNEANAWAAVLAEDAKSDIGIANIRDEMWHVLGRPRQSAYLDHVFPDGVAMYIDGDPRSQPVMMGLLISRILSATAPQWPKERLKEWAAAVEALRQPFAAAVEAHRPLEGSVIIARGSYRAALRAAHTRLREVKQQFKMLGMDESQIHEIIPDDTRPSEGPTPPKAQPPTHPSELPKAA